MADILVWLGNHKRAVAAIAAAAVAFACLTAALCARNGRAIPAVASARVEDAGASVDLDGELDVDAKGIRSGYGTLESDLAAVLQDGQKIHIPSEEELEQAQASPCISSPASSGSAMALIDLNTARVEELTTLPGVGEVTARTIVENREREGPFTSPEDLMRVPGIGEKKYERLKDRIRV